MTPLQVERLLGSIEWRHLEYNRLEKGGSDHRLEFQNDRLGNSYEIIKEGRKAEPEVTKRGMTLAQVIAIMGPPTKNCVMFPFDDAKNLTYSGYEICFVADRVSSKQIVEPHEFLTILLAQTATTWSSLVSAVQSCPMRHKKL